MKYLFKVKTLDEGDNLLNEFYIYLKYKEKELEYRRGLVCFAKPELNNNKLKFMAYAGEEDYRIIITIHNTELKTIKEIEMKYDDPNVINFDEGSAFRILKKWFTKLFNCEFIDIE